MRQLSGCKTFYPHTRGPNLTNHPHSLRRPLTDIFASAKVFHLMGVILAPVGLEAPKWYLSRRQHGRRVAAQLLDRRRGIAAFAGTAMHMSKRSSERRAHLHDTLSLHPPFSRPPKSPLMTCGTQRYTLSLCRMPSGSNDSACRRRLAATAARAAHWGGRTLGLCEP